MHKITPPLTKDIYDVGFVQDQQVAIKTDCWFLHVMGTAVVVIVW